MSVAPTLSIPSPVSSLRDEPGLKPGVENKSEKQHAPTPLAASGLDIASAARATKCQRGFISDEVLKPRRRPLRGARSSLGRVSRPMQVSKRQGFREFLSCRSGL